MGNSKQFGDSASPNAYIMSDDSIVTRANTMVGGGNSKPGEDAPTVLQSSPR